MSNSKRLPLSVPFLTGNEWQYVKACLDTGWISSAGEFVSRFEDEVAAYVGSEYGVAVNSGTSALHIALLLAGVKPDDYVLLPNLTFVATANAVSYTGALPMLVDVDPGSWQMDLSLLAEFLAAETSIDEAGACVYRRDGRRISAVVPVHVQGNIGDMHYLIEIASRHHLRIVEDAAESLGSCYQEQHAGTMGFVGCLSFNGNKIISCGGGGLILTNDEDVANRARHLTTTAKTDTMHYVHDQVGYNYRLVNVLAAIGVAQLEQLPDRLIRKRNIGEAYRYELTGFADFQFQNIADNVTYNHWLTTIQTEHQPELLIGLNECGMESRPLWRPMNKLPMFSNLPYISEHDHSAALAVRSLALPSSPDMTLSDVERVVDRLRTLVSHAGARRSVQASV